MFTGEFLYHRDQVPSNIDVAEIISFPKGTVNVKELRLYFESSKSDRNLFCSRRVKNNCFAIGQKEQVKLSNELIKDGQLLVQLDQNTKIFETRSVIKSNILKNSMKFSPIEVDGKKYYDIKGHVRKADILPVPNGRIIYPNYVHLGSSDISCIYSKFYEPENLFYVLDRIKLISRRNIIIVKYISRNLRRRTIRRRYSLGYHGVYRQRGQ